MRLQKRFRLFLFLVIGSIVFLGVHTAHAFEFPEGGTIGSEEVINDDVFLSYGIITIDGKINGIVFANASSLTLNGTVNGDLIANASMIEINGEVNGNLVAAGQIIRVNGTVTGSIFSTGSSLTLDRDATVGRNLYFAGFSLEMRPKSSVQRDLAISSRQAFLQGVIERDVVASTAAFVLAGEVGRDVKVTVEAPEEAGALDLVWLQIPGAPPPVESGLRIAPEAKIGGKLHYISPVEQDSRIESQPLGGIEYEAREQDTPQKEQRRAFFVGRLQDLITLLVIGVLAVWLIPLPLQHAAEQACRPLPALGKGILITFGGFFLSGGILLAMIIVSILLGIVHLEQMARLVTWAGIPAAVLLLALFLIVVLHGSKLVVAVALGQWIIGRFRPGYADHPFWPLLTGVLSYIGMSAIPLPALHWLIVWLVTFIGMGSIWRAYRRKGDSTKAEENKTE